MASAFGKTRYGRSSSGGARMTAPTRSDESGIAICPKWVSPFAERIDLALLYGSVPKGTDTANSDIDLLVIADELMLEELYLALVPVETSLGRKINPTLYTSREFGRRRDEGSAFLKRVLSGKHIVLFGEERDASAAR